MTNGKRVVVGAVAGLVGAYAMQQFRTAWNRNYAANPCDAVYGLDEEADLKSANLLTKFFAHRTLPKQDALRLALLLHYGYGAIAGAGYAISAATWPPMKAGCGSLFGTGVWLLGDELPISLSGLSDPFARSVRSHVSALAAHLLFGATTELTRSVLLLWSR
jgi:uncharacterized membrane protein YagU involved in acid resistance